MILSTKRLLLSPVDEADWTQYANILREPDVTQHTNIADNPTDKKVQSIIKWMIKISSNGKGMGWMIREQGSDNIIGCIRLNKINKTHSTAIIGYELSRASWGKGLMTEALELVVKYCFEERNLFRLEAWTVPENKASEHVLLKCKFTKEGIAKQNMVFKDQRWDSCMFGRLITD